MSYKATVLIESLASLLILSFSHTSWTARIRRLSQQKAGRVSRLKEKRIRRVFQRFRYDKKLVRPGEFVLRCRGLPVAVLTFWRIRYYLVFPFLLFICSNAIFQTPSS